jgi:mannose-6-phosphate isomerase-like protein (cupin superfamily)
LDGTPDILIGQDWRRCSVGDFVRIPRGVMHDFRNLTDGPATLLNVFMPGGFERDMPQIVAWFAQNP